MIKEFKAFVLKGNVLDMAVGIIIGVAFGAIVGSLVNDVLMPPIGMALSGIDFSELGLKLKDAVTDPADSSKTLKPAVVLGYGKFINAVINFAIVAFVIFMLVKGVNRLRPAAPPPTTRECPECLSAIALKAKRCCHCASAVSPA